MTLLLREIDDAVGCGYDFINNMVRYGQFQTALPDTVPGKAREFTRDNAIEVALRFSAARAGMRAKEVAEFAGKWREALASAVGPLFLAVNPTNGQYVTFSSGAVSVFDLTVMLEEGGKDDAWYADDKSVSADDADPMASIITIIDLRNLLSRIDAAIAAKQMSAEPAKTAPELAQRLGEYNKRQQET